MKSLSIILFFIFLFFYLVSIIVFIFTSYNTQKKLKIYLGSLQEVDKALIRDSLFLKANNGWISKFLVWSDHLTFYAACDTYEKVQNPLFDIRKYRNFRRFTEMFVIIHSVFL